MIDWDMKLIEKIDQHYNEIISPSVNLIYFCRHFEEIYRMTLDDEVLIPDIFNDITFYTYNGINAKYKMLFFAKHEEQTTEKLLAKRMEQRAKRQEARQKGLDEYYSFMIEEVQDFIKKYPFWNNLLRK